MNILQNEWWHRVGYSALSTLWLTKANTFLTNGNFYVSLLYSIFLLRLLCKIITERNLSSVTCLLRAVQRSRSSGESISGGENITICFCAWFTNNCLRYIYLALRPYAAHVVLNQTLWNRFICYLRTRLNFTHQT